MAQPWLKYQQGPGTPPADPVIAVDPYKQEDQQIQRDDAARAAEDQQMQREKFKWEQERAATQDRKADAGTVDEKKIATLTTRIVGGLSDILNVTAENPEAQAPGFVEGLRGDLMPGGIGGMVTRGIAGPSRRTTHDAQRDMLDALLTLGTGAAYNAEQLSGQMAAYFPQYAESEEETAVKNQRLVRLIEAAKANAGPAWTKVEPAIAPYLTGLTGAQQKTPAAMPPPGMGAPPPVVPSTGGTKQTLDPETAAEVEALVRRGASLAEINKLTTSKGLSQVNPKEYAAVRKFLQQFPNYEGSLVNAWKMEPLSGSEKAINSVAQSGPGAAMIGAGNFLSGNNLDSIAGAVGGDEQGVRNSLALSQQINPNWNAAGEIAGGIIGGIGGEAALGRLGMSAGMFRGVAADATLGGINGAGMADNGNRIGNALLGAGASAAGSGAGSATVKGVSRAVGPTGGSMNALYDAGVRPTLGQRVADKGFVGRAVNKTEEALQSVPVVGAAISSARQEARDQFQVGAFNEALKEVGERLPKGMKPGTEPHAYAQKTFDRVYAEARKGMRLVADEELGNDLSGLSERVALLSEPSAKRFKAMLQNIVTRRVRDGELAGDAYKSAHSEIGKQIRSIRSNPTGDGELAEALTDLQSILDNSARRHSDPDAVALLDAADAGYAKLVRIEDAAKRRGGDAGTFSGTQFDSAVQKESGGTRSKAYLRGDGLMQDYATAGKALDDKVPNSGTTDRALVAGTGATAIAGYMEPSLLAFLGAIGTAYAPGVRKVMQGALKPAGTKRQAIANQLRKRARLVGAAGGASSVAALPATSPGQ